MKYLMLLVIALSLVIVLGCTGTEGTQGAGTNFTFTFHVQQTNETLNGKVYLHNELIGETQNGVLAVPKSSVFPGTISLNGTYNGSTFGFTFELNRDDVENHSGVNYVVLEQNIKQISYNWSNVDTSALPQKIFDKINAKRTVEGLKTFKWSDKVALAAGVYAKELAEKGWDYRHDAADIFLENSIFSRSTSYIDYDASHLAPETDIATTAVDNWYSNPSLKNIITEDYLDTAGSAVYCKEKQCMVVIDFASTEYSETFELKQNYCTYREIFWQDLPFSSVNTKITVNSTDSMNVYVLGSENDYRACTPYHYIEQKKNVNSFETQLNVNKSMLLMFESIRGSNITYKYEYMDATK
jgi:uncharacterized protein YkwD